VNIGNFNKPVLYDGTSGEIKSRRNLRMMSYIILTFADFIALAIGFLVPQLIYFGSLQQTHGVVMFSVLAPIYLGVALLNRAFTSEVLDNIAAGIFRSLQAFIFAAGSLLLIAYAIKAGAEFSRIVFASGVLLTTIMLIINRMIVRRPILALLGGSPYTTIVVRDCVDYQPAEGEIILEPSAIGFDPTTQDPYVFHAFAETVGKADRIIVACPADRYALWSSVLKGLAVKGEIISDEQIDIGILSLAWHGDHRTMVVAAGALALRDRIVKRLLDIVVSTIGLITLSPLLVGVAIAIKLESKGAVFFLQNRVGRDNKLFRVFKFRSMYTDLCDANAAQLTTRNDSRVTKVGNFIRRTSIDELPQLINVLKGDMSIVGPRPHPLSAKAADQLYWDVDPRYRHRHSMKPGITGLAQVRGFRGNTEQTVDLTNRLQADLEYLIQWSIWRDISIILQTFLVIRHNNAF
jgi:polysaccharide biosynthesis protein PslA